MKREGWLKNIIYLLLISILFWIGVKIRSDYFEKFKTTFETNILFISLVNFIFFGGIGFVLGLDNLIRELKKDGKIKVNISKLIVLGLPVLILSIPYSWLMLGPKIISLSTYLVLICNLILGHTLATSITKE